MDKESIIALQRIDCNCNNCGFMERDFCTYQKWEEWKKDIAKEDFDRKREKAIVEAKENEDLETQKVLLAKAKKMQFQFDKSKLIQYGTCHRFRKEVSFIPNTCSLENQSCFIHRKDIS